MATFSEKLKAARESRYPRVTQADAANLLGLKRTTYVNYESGITEPSPAMLRIVADAWSIPFDWFYQPGVEVPLLTGESPGPRYVVNAITVEIPMWPAVPAGDWEAPADSTDFYEADPRIAGRDRIATKIIGDSMLPLLQQGDLVIVQLDQAPPVGTVVLARNGHREATVKVLAHENGAYVLKPLNEAHKPAKAREWETLGYVVAIIRDRGPEDYSVTYKRSGIRP